MRPIDELQELFREYRDEALEAAAEEAKQAELKEAAEGNRDEIRAELEERGAEVPGELHGE